MKSLAFRSMPMALTLAGACFLAACAQSPLASNSAASASNAGSTHTMQPHWPAQQCQFATTVDDWASVTQRLQTGQGVVRLRANGVEAAPDIMTRVLDLGQVQVRSAKTTASISRVGTPNRLPQAWTKSTGDETKDAAQRASNRLNGNGYFGDAIDLRFRFPAWEHAFALSDAPANTPSGECERHSLLFFNAAGDLIHSVTLANSSHTAVFEQITAEFRHADQTAPTPSSPEGDAEAQKVADAAVDIKAYHAAWNGITDVHQFNRIMRDFQLGREQALRMGPPDKVRALHPAAMRVLLEKAAAQSIPIMVFLSNGAVTQIHSGEIYQVRQAGEWLVVDDPDAYITLKAAAVKSAWAVERGGVYSVDFFDANAQLITTIFGVRSRENPRPAPWIDLVQSLPGS